MATQAPQSVEAEEAVLGAALRSEYAARLVTGTLTAADFYHPTLAMIHAAMVRLRDGHEPIDTLTVADQLTRMGNLEKVGGVANVAKLWDQVPSAANVSYYVGVVAEHALRRRILDAAAQIRDLANRIDVDIGEVVTKADQTMADVARTYYRRLRNLGCLY